MKRFITIILTTIMALSALCSCGEKKDTTILYEKLLPDLQVIFEYNSKVYAAVDDTIEKGDALLENFTEENKKAFIEAAEYCEQLVEDYNIESSLDVNDLFDLTDEFGLSELDYRSLWDNNAMNLSFLCDWGACLDVLETEDEFVTEFFEIMLGGNKNQFKTERLNITYGMMYYIADLDKEDRERMTEEFLKYPELWLEDAEWISDKDKIREIKNAGFDAIEADYDELYEKMDELSELILDSYTS